MVVGLSSFPGVTVDDQPVLLPRDIAAHAAGVQPDTVKKWTTRGWVDPDTGQRRFLKVADRDWRGNPLYDYPDVMAAEKATRRRGRKRGPQHWAALNVKSA